MTVPCLDYYKKIQLDVIGISTAEKTSDDVLRYDGDVKLLKGFKAAVVAQENKEKKTNDIQKQKNQENQTIR